MFSRLKEKFNIQNNEIKKRAILLGRIEELNSENIELKESLIKLNTLGNKEIVDVFLGDPSPVDVEEYKLYVARVAGLYQDILCPKIKYMISQSHHLLKESSNDRDYDQAIKGAIYALSEIMRWGESMVNKQIAIQTQEKDIN